MTSTRCAPVRRTTRLVAGVLAAFLALGASALAFPSTAQAESPADGLWYFSALHVQQAHDAGWTGTGVTIAVIDDQINPEIPTLVGANVEVRPSSGKCLDDAGQPVPPATTSLGAIHGTGVVALIAGTGAAYPGKVGAKGVAPGARVLFYSDSFGSATPGDTSIHCADDSVIEGIMADSIDDAVAAGAQIISISQVVGQPSELVAAIARAEHRGVVVLGGLPNNAHGSTTGFPYGANGVVGVRAMDSTGAIQTTNGAPNLSTATDVVGPGVGLLVQGALESGGSWELQSEGKGTSLATPIVAGFLAMVKQKYPKATGNQLIQTLIRNTGGGNHPLTFDKSGELGYGVASLTHMLTVDPATYPDKNPLISTKVGQRPSAKQIATGGETASPSPSSSAVAAPSSHAGALPGWLVPVLVGGLVFLFVVIAAVVLVIVLVTRRARPAARDIRCFGSSALHLCWVANGRLDAYYQRDMQPWDYAAGALIAEEAGARLEHPSLANGQLMVAASPHVFEGLLALLA